MGKNPFKGLYCYEEADKDIFYGRENEAAELFSLVALNGLTVVFGKSGIGKTSLLNAGLFPLLRVEDKFLPVRMRLDYSPGGLPLLDQVKQAIQRELKKHDIVAIEKGVSELTGSFAEGESLWEYFHRVDHINKSFCGGVGGEAAPPPQEGPSGHLESRLIAAPNFSDSSRDTHHSSLIIHHSTVIPVLVFDQFEELFTIGKHHGEREKLIEELYWLIEDQVPPAVKERVLMNRDMVSYLRAQAVVRVVFGLREDYLPHLNTLKRRIPSIHRVLFRIIHLNGYQAREVMDKSGAFREEKIKQELLLQFYPGDMEPGETVADEKLEVEPALLSLLCYQVFERGVETLSGREKDAILAAFYDQVLGELPRGRELGEWIETHLLTEGGFRTPLYLERAHELRETVDAAVDKKLLRKLYIGEKEHVEIIHDVLAPVIRERRDQRLEEKKRKELEKEMRRKRIITAIISAVGVIGILLAIFAFVQKNRADEQTKITKENLKFANIENKRANELWEVIKKNPQIQEDLSSINLEYEKYCEAVGNRLASESNRILPTDNKKAIRIAETAYKIGSHYPPPAVVQALTAAAYSTQEYPFYTTTLKHNDSVIAIVFPPDGSKILTAYLDDTANLWDLQGKPLTNFTGHFRPLKSVAFSPDGSKILTASTDNTAKLWDLHGKLLAELKGHTENVTSVAFSPDGSKILTASTDNTAKLWDIKGNLLAQLNGHKYDVTGAEFSPDGSNILITSVDGTAKLWDLNGKLLTDFRGYVNVVTSAVISPGGSSILTASSDGTAKLWDSQGNLMINLKGHKNSLTSAVFSPEGTIILTTSWDGTAKLWDLHGNLLVDLKGHTMGVYSSLFSPDGSKILTASLDKTAKLWDLNGNLLVDIKGNTDSVIRAVFSSDGKKILTASGDNTAKLWDLQGNLLADLKGHTDRVNSAVFSPDGKRIVTASNDGTAIIWLTPEGIMEYLKTAPIPKLTQKEKDELGIAGFKIN